MPEIYQAVTSVLLPSGETADFTFWMNAGDTIDAVSAYNAWSTYLAGSSTWKGLFPTATAFREGVVHSVDQGTGVVTYTSVAGTAYSGSGLGGALPPQCSEVITLRTARAGRSYTGRMYMPSTGDITLTTSGRMLTSCYTDLADEMAAAFIAAKAAASGVEIVVYSRLHRTVASVLSVDCGDVFDTQRRRRDKLVEVRHTAMI